MQAVFERLVAYNIQILPTIQIANHIVFERDGFLALVERRGESFGSIGSAGMLIEGKFAPLVWRGDQPFFVGKGVDAPADASKVEDLRRFQRELSDAIGG